MPNVGVQQQKVGEGFAASLDLSRALRRKSGDVIEDRPEIGKSREGIAKPHRPCSFNFATGGSGFGGGDSGLLVGRERRATAQG